MTAHHRLKGALILTSLVMLGPLPSQAAEGSACVMTQATIARDETGIRETMAAYNAALNGGKRRRYCRSTPRMASSCLPTASPRSA